MAMIEAGLFIVPETTTSPSFGVERDDAAGDRRVDGGLAQLVLRPSEGGARLADGVAAPARPRSRAERSRSSACVEVVARGDPLLDQRPLAAQLQLGVAELDLRPPPLRRGDLAAPRRRGRARR